MSKRRAKQARATKETSNRDELAGRVERFALGTMASLFVVAVLIPTDSIPHVGNSVVIVMLWMVAACVFLVSAVIRGSIPMRFGATSTAVLVLLIIHVFSALVMIAYGEGNARAAINMVWRWTSLILAFLLVRQIVRSPAQCRGLCAVMIALAVGVSSFGLFQYFYVNPARKAEFNQLPSEVAVRGWLTERGLPYHEPGTPARRHLVDRIIASEPVGTFALTNSLGAFIVPWLTLAIAIALVGWSMPQLRHHLTAGAILVCLLAGLCLLLTKSRTSWLAFAFGILALGTYFWFFGLRWSWKLPAVAVAAAIVMFVIATAVGGIDAEVVGETFKSFSYRIEYWQATWGMIADHPWLGCGPGNFKESYTQYKLPSASESVGDPHNIVFEIWATTGTIGLLAFVATIGFAVVHIVRHRSRPDAGQESSTESNVGENSEVMPIYVGAMVGVFLSTPIGWSVGSLPSFAIIAVGVPAAIGSVLLLHAWVLRGSLPAGPILIAMAALLVNLLAAGGIGYLGVASSWWLLLAIALNLVEPKSGGRKLGRGPVIVMLVLMASATVACQQTALLPVFQARTSMINGDQRQAAGSLVEAEDMYADAARFDPYSPDPWARLVDVAMRQWHASGARSTATFQRFEGYVEELRRLDSRSHTTHLFIGNRYLQAYLVTKKNRLLNSAIESYQDAVSRYPNGNFHHAQLAWAQFLAENFPAARASADEALRLDALNPHQEKHLRQRFIFSGSSEKDPENAEHLMKKIRKATGGDNPLN